MPPRLQLLRACTRPTFITTCAQTPIATFLAPILLRSGVYQQSRNASILSSISDTKGAYNKRIRLGRGPASGKGKTSGRGHKGQNQHGKVPRGFNGGQTREAITSPPRGKGNQIHHFTIDLVPLNVDRIQQWIDQGRLNPKKPITMKELQRSRCTHGVKDGVKLLARNAEQLRTPVNIIVSRASAGAIAAVEAAGGTVTTRYYTRPAIRRILSGQTDPINSMMSAFPSHIARETSTQQWTYRLPDASSRSDLEYYRDPAHRGYLSHMLSENEGPSLFYNVDKKKGKKTVVSEEQTAAAAAKKKKKVPVAELLF